MVVEKVGERWYKALFLRDLMQPDTLEWLRKTEEKREKWKQDEGA
jgi:hypothetical protein